MAGQITALLFCLCELVYVTNVAFAYDNIASGKSTRQLNPYNSISNVWGANLAVDGQKSNFSSLGGQCTVSDNNKRTAKWWVDLGGVLSIHQMTIYYRTDNVAWDSNNDYTARFLGFSVYISNTTNKDDGVLCFKDTMYTNATIPNTTTITCARHGRYVIYYNERLQNVNYPDGYSQYAYNELCEFEVYGFPIPGVYGENCNNQCPQNCQERHCDIVNGTCLGCIPGYKGSVCDQACVNKRYGLECKQNCGNCSDGEQCNHVNGSCPNGCDAGAQGDKCDQGQRNCRNAYLRNYFYGQCHRTDKSNVVTPWGSECLDGWYGKNCATQCNPNCRGCNRFNARCESGCLPGWKGPLCEKECDAILYGENCTQHCGQCRDLEQCNHINGTCLNGCDRGYQGEECTEECPAGYYGYNCHNKCNINCGVPEICDRVTGQCQNGCQAGWKNRKCDSKCDGATFGLGCNQPCGVCLGNEPCHHVNGTCTNGCDRGYKGINCKHECGWTSFGYNCNETCSMSCFNQTCDTVTGSCVQFDSDQTNYRSNAQFLKLAMIIFSVENNDRVGQTFTDIIYENLDPKDKLISKPERKSTPVTNAKKYETKTDYDTDDEGVENPYGDLYINEETIADVPVSQLESVIVEKKKDGEDGFKREYAMLPYGEQHQCDAGKRPENVPRNRFKTTSPYDHSRVILKGDNGTSSDYINANYINGTDEENEYIASQGPKQNTLVDFWAMIWQDNVSQIVMLTNLKEGVKIKCTQYWPEEMKTRAFGQLVVKFVEEKKYAFYVIRKLSVSHKELKKSRVVRQYHYTSWPDHGTPDPLCLVVFHDLVTRTKPNQNKAPIVVHCSAGIGQTGTYIALDALYKAGKATGKVNIAEYVKTMRANRMNMVQTYEQYMTVFLALNEYFKFAVDTQSLNQFMQKAEQLAGDQPANQTTIRKEFELLIKIRPMYTPTDYKIASQHNSNKNEYDLLPLDKYSLYLTSSVAKRGNFINAIHVPSYTDDRTFIVTNYPSAEGAVDFLRLLNDHESNTVICMDPLREIESSKAWFPDPGSTKSLPPFEVCHRSENSTDVKITKAHISRDEETPQIITIVEPQGPVQSSGTPRDTSFLRNLVSFAQNPSTEYPITVVSKNGAMLCGVFCSVYNVIQQLKMDDNIDVFTAVRQLQTRRPEFCSTQDEYLLVYRAVCDYIEATSENVYYNQ
ncbi:receptor-type tyrosine-protein phosphatase T-like [Ostrea edulis]|uniref:receptor-type tyrosine-protein phosphatase T-like n=1 Tax=Ostrea edulis TaxID=37623 RepID=UPI0024AFB05A|nr:receptor-type tyrosine-protein phosphatase T-like [Ostrea edulis]